MINLCGKIDDYCREPMVSEMQDLVCKKHDMYKCGYERLIISVNSLDIIANIIRHQLTDERVYL